MNTSKVVIKSWCFQIEVFFYWSSTQEGTVQQIHDWMESVLLAAGSEFEQILMCEPVSLYGCDISIWFSSHCFNSFSITVERHVMSRALNHSLILALLNNAESVWRRTFLWCDWRWMRTHEICWNTAAVRDWLVFAVVKSDQHHPLSVTGRCCACQCHIKPRTAAVKRSTLAYWGQDGHREFWPTCSCWCKV